ncbi:MAG TPA: VWA domain-containing protein [Polyangiaceae bacterium]|nr:VWA domain-containing protein [Polyangiaceae bacterium]
MRFADPLFLVIAAVAVAVLCVLFVALARRRRSALAKIGSMRLLPGLTASLSRRRRLIKQTAIVTGAALVCVALARPELGYRWEEAHQRGVDVLFAIDTSKSMLTRDVKPNRLERAKLAVRSLVEKFPSDRVGLVAFAGSAFVETPLTLDHGIFDESVAALDTNVIPLGGTNIAGAIDQADKALSGDTHEKVLVLITDGEDLSGDAVQAAERAAKDGVVIYTLGVGTPKGELIPVPGKEGQTEFVRDEAGALVTSRLDDTRLGKIARATGGDYRPLGDGGQGLESLYRDELSKLPQSDLASRSVRVPLERFQWPLGAALLLLAIEPLVSERRRRRVPKRAPGRSAALAALLVAPAALLVAPAALASPQSAQQAYQKGDFGAAEQQYAAAAQATPGDPRLSFNVGAAAYRKGDFERAGKAFESSLRSDDLGVQEQAYYNLGNASFRLGEATLAKNDIEATKGRWKQSIGEYEGALRLRANDADAKYNLELVKRRLAELDKKQQEEQQKKEQQKQQQQNQKQNGKGSQDQKQNGGDAKEQPKQDGGQGARASKPKPGQGAQQSATHEEGHEEQVAPGELSKGDAEALLDSLRGELKLGERAPKTKQTANPQEPRRDW